MEGAVPFFRRECTERESRVKPLRFAPTANAARCKRRAGLTRLPLRSCLVSHWAKMSKNGLLLGRLRMSAFVF
jgi:hypothetical protein